MEKWRDKSSWVKDKKRLLMITINQTQRQKYKYVVNIYFMLKSLLLLPNKIRLRKPETKMGTTLKNKTEIQIYQKTQWLPKCLVNKGTKNNANRFSKNKESHSNLRNFFYLLLWKEQSERRKEIQIDLYRYSIYFILSFYLKMQIGTYFHKLHLWLL